MKLDQYIRALGMTEGHFFLEAKVPPGIAHTVERGEPVAESYARRIVEFLSKEFQRPITLRDVEDLRTC